MGLRLAVNDSRRDGARWNLGAAWIARTSVSSSTPLRATVVPLACPEASTPMVRTRTPGGIILKQFSKSSAAFCATCRVKTTLTQASISGKPACRRNVYLARFRSWWRYGRRRWLPRSHGFCSVRLENAVLENRILNKLSFSVKLIVCPHRASAIARCGYLTINLT